MLGNNKRVSRRRTLQVIGGGLAIGVGTVPAQGTGAQDVFVHPQGSQSDAVAALQDHGGGVTFTYSNFEFIAGVVPGRNRAELANDGRVELVEDDGTVEAFHHDDGHDGGPPGGGGDDDDGGCSDHPAQELPWGIDRIDADKVTEDGNGVDVAILDTGIDTGHCDLNVQGGTNCTGKGKGFEDKNGHGTHCAGIAAGLDNGIGVVGAAPAADLWAVKVLDNSGSGSWSNVVCGIDWCMTNNREILSMSFGADSMPDSVHTSLSDAYAAGHLLVAAAGNDGNDEDGSCGEDNVGQPARHDDVIAVSAMDPDDTLASYSSVGSEVELLGPGTDIRSTYKGDSYDTLSGTSMACPHVTGVGALVWGANGYGDPEAGDNDNVRGTLQDTAEVVLDTCEEGNGLVDAGAAVS